MVDKILQLPRLLKHTILFNFAFFGIWNRYLKNHTILSCSGYDSSVGCTLHFHLFVGILDIYIFEIIRELRVHNYYSFILGIC